MPPEPRLAGRYYRRLGLHAVVIIVLVYIVPYPVVVVVPWGYWEVEAAGVVNGICCPVGIIEVLEL